MSIPASKEALEDLEKLVEANDKAGDWVHITFPKSAITLLGQIRLPRQMKDKTPRVPK